MKNPTVDVVIPTYNGLPYLKEAVDSVLAQTYQDFILYIIDDGSTDKKATQKYVKALKDPRVNYFRKPNGGQATARNYGIRKSSSEYLAFLDSDDIWLPDKIREQVGYLNKNPDAGLVYGYHYLINEHEKVVGEVKYNREGKLFKYLVEGNRISGSGSMVMVRRSVFDDVGLFREDFLIGEDWEMWLRIAYKYQIGCIHKFLARLRALPEGMQKDYLKMARGLEYMLPIMLKEFKLSPRSRARLRGACLYDASVYYFLGGDRAKARAALLKVMLYNPSRIKVRKDLMFIYVRTLFGSEMLRKFRRTVSPGYRRREREYELERQKKGRA
jgi:glycosyltransferase involved in cell wall biosynthesis